MGKGELRNFSPTPMTGRMSKKGQCMRTCALFARGNLGRPLKGVIP